jgi:hypothetical protein
MWQDAALSTNCHPVPISAMNRAVVLLGPCAWYIIILAEISEFFLSFALDEERELVNSGYRIVLSVTLRLSLR